MANENNVGNVLPKITAEQFYNSGFAGLYKDFASYEAERLRQISVHTLAAERDSEPKKEVTNPINERAKVEREELQQQYNTLKKELIQNEQQLTWTKHYFDIYQTDESYDKYVDAQNQLAENRSLADLLLDFIGMRNDTIRRTSF